MIGFKTERFVRFNRIDSLILKCIGSYLVDQPDSSALLIDDVEDDAFSLFLDHFHGEVELISTITPDGAKSVSSQTLGMSPDKGGFPLDDITRD